MADANLPVQGRLLDESRQALELTGIAAHFDVAVFEDSQASRIIAAIFEAL
jgi:hypothetical protein